MQLVHQVVLYVSHLLLKLLFLFSELLLGLLLHLLSLFSELLSHFCLEPLFLLLQLLSKYALKGLKCGLVEISRLLNCANGLLVDFRRRFNRGSTDSSSTSRPNSLRRLRLLGLFLDQPLNLRAYLLGRTLLSCTKWVILIGLCKIV